MSAEATAELLDGDVHEEVGPFPGLHEAVQSRSSTLVAWSPAVYWRFFWKERPEASGKSNAVPGPKETSSTVAKTAAHRFRVDSKEN